MRLTAVQQKYFAWDISHRKSTSDDSRFTGVLSEARVDLNPHQVDAALFAFKSPLSKGAILADEVGLGKTIEAGIILSQFWAEHRRRILIILPASLRGQWSIELIEKFYLPSSILVSSSYNNLKETGKNPFDQEAIILCSYQFAAKHSEEIAAEHWDLVILDEAHKMRNVYKKKNKTSNLIRSSIQPFKKVLLTATPLQNNLNELYGLVSMVDMNYFSTIDNFSEEYNAVSTRDASRYGELKERLRHIIHRTLRRDVQEYVKYTRRSAMVQDFSYNENEQCLYDYMTEYLQRPWSFGIPEESRALMTIMLRKIMASSAHALSQTLRKMIDRLESYKSTGILMDGLASVLGQDIDGFLDDPNDDVTSGLSVDSASMGDLQAEIDDLKKYRTLAESIGRESKADKLLAALNTGFAKMESMGASRKALIFTESCRTQDYLKDFLAANGYDGKVVCFNGTNTSPEAKAIHSSWLKKNNGTDLISGDSAIDRKQALVDYFKDEADIMIATEAGAEGINLQFCSMVINYDMPWNPQRIEQRIGRCHRYGQKHDVVVINFVNQSNAADRRVYELLNSKFNLFEGVFGSSDEILGALDGSLDFEGRLNQIWRTCRTEEEICQAFDQLQAEMESVILARMNDSKRTLLENFDEDVVRKLKDRERTDSARIDDYVRHFWGIAHEALDGHIVSTDPKQMVVTVDDSIEGVEPGRYSVLKYDDCRLIRRDSPIGHYILSTSSEIAVPATKIRFNLSDYKYRSSTLERFSGQSGICIGYKVTAESKCDLEETVLICGVSDSGEVVPDDFGKKILELEHSSEDADNISPIEIEMLGGAFSEEIERYKSELAARSQEYLNIEIDKLYAWADDHLYPIEDQVGKIRKQLEANRRLSKKTSSASERLELKKEELTLRNQLKIKMDECEKLREYYDRQSEEQIAEMDKALQNKVSSEVMFAFRWELD